MKNFTLTLSALLIAFLTLSTKELLSQNYGNWLQSPISEVGIKISPSPQYGLSVGPGTNGGEGASGSSYGSGIYAIGNVGIKAHATPSSGFIPSIPTAIWGVVEGNKGTAGRFEGGSQAGLFVGNVKVTANTLIEGDLEVNNKVTANTVHVQDKIFSKEVHVKLPPFPDYVFENDYSLMPLNELDGFIQINKRLPNMPSAEDVAENGAELGDMQVRLTEKIEELTLYILEMNKRLEKLEAENQQLKSQLKDLQKD